MTGMSDKWQITAVFCGSPLGDFLPIQIIYKGKTTQCHPLLSRVYSCVQYGTWPFPMPLELVFYHRRRVDHP